MKYYIPFISLFLINTVTSEVCYFGGLKNLPVNSNDNSPPCWYKTKDGTYSCYDFTDGKCPFPGNIKLPTNNKPKIKCYRGNMKQHPVSGTTVAPPCWYREPDGTYSCYEYQPHTKKCPNFPHRVKPQS
ncbi:hypothetical protein K501DRAFT_278904 [Backusella circina FSU 941]|nr:hypothetical protein K501DRAFT_278904 [Backusella circina FSU 941]